MSSVGGSTQVSSTCSMVARDRVLESKMVLKAASPKPRGRRWSRQTGESTGGKLLLRRWCLLARCVGCVVSVGDGHRYCSRWCRWGWCILSRRPCCRVLSEHHINSTSSRISLRSCPTALNTRYTHPSTGTPVAFVSEFRAFVLLRWALNACLIIWWLCGGAHWPPVCCLFFPF